MRPSLSSSRKNFLSEKQAYFRAHQKCLSLFFQIVCQIFQKVKHTIAAKIFAFLLMSAVSKNAVSSSDLELLTFVFLVF